ncbi:hypothetical protein LWC33_30395 [Pseudonocardia sp. RS11V-5]|uniref:hypothetical protein n=1 Tax=Pseudonocardia terrae TaxID=2905831 RepID=UPI001E424F3A|nr:hypothetical protein [Pseudonocardia terrae]MCE3555740.1 hypothetical protein [Pseudonocardia terrae]
MLTVSGLVVVVLGVERLGVVVVVDGVGVGFGVVRDFAVVVGGGAVDGMVVVVFGGVVVVLRRGVVVEERDFGVVFGGRDDEVAGTTGGGAGGAASFSGVSGLSTPLAERTNGGLWPPGQLTTAGVTRFRATVSAE